MKRENILEAAEQLFAEKGYEGTSVRDIARQARVNIAMISYYFGSKEKLFGALVEYRAGYTLFVLEGLSKDETTGPMEKIEKLVDFYVDKIFLNHRFHNIMSRQFSLVQDPKITNRLMEIKERNIDQIRKIILDGQKKKVFRKVDVELTVATLIGTISQITLAKPYYCKLMHIDAVEEEFYKEKLSSRIKNHLKQLLSAHLDFKNL
ncbi:MAG: TetR/AcrR family transcriptional regulator [Chitinophagaceae bacterium]